MTDVMITEFLVFSDHHAHTFAYGAKEEPYSLQGYNENYANFLVNSRLHDAFKVIQQIKEYALENKIRRVFFCGDMFHVRENVPTVALNLMHDAIYELSEVSKICMIPGNHDYSDRAGKIHSLRILNTNVFDWKIEQDERSHEFDSGKGDLYRVSFLPFTDDRELAVKEIVDFSKLTTPGTPHILFAHLGIQGATVGSDYVLVSENDLSVEDIPWQKFTACFFGHYHQHQQLFANGWYVGASHQHNWGDANTVRGFLHVKVYVDHVEFVQIETDAPKFIVSKGPTEARPKDFVRILTKQQHTLKEIDQMKQDAKSDNCEVIYIPADAEKSAIQLSEENLSPTTMVASWVTANAAWLTANLPEVDHDALISYGRTLLTELK